MKCWIITQGAIGMENQCLGVAEALGLTAEMKVIGLRQPWRSLSPWMGLESAQTFTGTPLTAPWPDIAIACGRKSIAALRYIRKQSGGHTFTCFIQNPKIDTSVFDLVAIPEHDPRRGPNVLVTTAAPHRVSPRKLAEGRAQWSDTFAALPSPRVAVIIGGKSQTHDLTPQNVERIGAQLRKLAQDGNSLMVTMSRRTGDENTAAFKRALDGTGAWIWDNTDPNPYFGMLAWADYVIVTSDSVSMISEAASTAKPVLVAEIDGGSDRFNRFYDNLLKKGVIRIFDGSLPSYSYDPVNDSQKIADEIRGRMALRASRAV